MHNDHEQHHLQLSRAEMQALGYQIVDLLVDHVEHVRDKPVARIATRQELEQQLRTPAPEHERDPHAVIQELQAHVFPHMMHVNHPRFFAFVPIPGNFVGAMADALAAGLNVFAGTWMAGSGAAEIELVTIEWLRQWCGLPDTAGGLFVSGGSMANLTALAVARHVQLQDDITDAVVYASDQTHSSVDRALRVLGFPPPQMRKLPADAYGRLEFPPLQEAVIADRATGKRPFCVIANAGTTNTGAVDPLLALADFCQREHLWLHVDGAYGAPAVLCEQGRALLAGLERADSVALDPHKWLFQPLEIGCVLLRERQHLRDTFHILPEYLKDTERAAEEVNFCDYGIQLTRSFRALKLWMSIEVFGVAAFRDAIAWGIGLAELAENIVRNSGNWEVVTPAQLGILTFRYRRAGQSDAELDRLSREVAALLLTGGFAAVSTTVIAGRTVLRLCTNNPRTTEEDIRATIQHLEQLAQRQFRSY